MEDIYCLHFLSMFYRFPGISLEICLKLSKKLRAMSFLCAQNILNKLIENKQIEKCASRGLYFNPQYKLTQTGLNYFLDLAKNNTKAKSKHTHYEDFKLNEYLEIESKTAQLKATLIQFMFFRRYEYQSLEMIRSLLNVTTPDAYSVITSLYKDGYIRPVCQHLLWRINIRAVKLKPLRQFLK